MHKTAGITIRQQRGYIKTIDSTKKDLDQMYLSSATHDLFKNSTSPKKSTSGNHVFSFPSQKIKSFSHFLVSAITSLQLISHFLSWTTPIKR